MIGFLDILRNFHRGIALIAILLLSIQPLLAQDEEVISDEDYFILADKIQSFVDETTELMDYVGSAQTAQLESINHFAEILTTRWKGFLLLEQEVLSQDDSLMVMVTQYEQSMKLLTDSIASRRNTLQQYSDFVRAEKFVSQHIKVYEQMREQADLLSLTEKTAADLENLKTREQLLFTELQQHYDKACAAAANDVKLQKRLKKIEDGYIEMKTLSGEIQKVAYKPLMERLKDYLLGIACVAVVLMFLNMLVSRVQAFRQMRKAAKDMKKMMDQQNNDIPTI